mgnify:CR=1 FL=1
MPTSHASTLYDIDDFKITKLLTDTATAPTYSTPSVDVPGIASLSMQPNIQTGSLKGDAKVLARKGKTDSYGLSVTYGRLSLDALVVLIGGNVTDVTNTAKWVHSGTNSLPYFKAQGQILQNDVGDVHVTAYKAQVTGGTLLDQSTDNFGQPSIDMEAIPCTSDDTKFVEIEFMDVVTPLA